MPVQRTRYDHSNVNEEDEEALFLEIIASLPHGAVFVSIGTAIGYYPLLARKIRPDLVIHCFEPLPSHQSFFLENIELNGVSRNEFHIHPLAISTRRKKVLLRDHSYGSYIFTVENRDLLNNLPNQKQLEKSTILVDAITLKEVNAFINIPFLDFVQIDIQGHEASVLGDYFTKMGDQNKMVSRFLIGTHGLKIHQNCRNSFLENGYRLLLDQPDPKNQADGILYAVQ